MGPWRTQADSTASSIGQGPSDPAGVTHARSDPDQPRSHAPRAAQRAGGAGARARTSWRAGRPGDAGSPASQPAACVQRASQLAVRGALCAGSGGRTAPAGCRARPRAIGSLTRSPGPPPPPSSRPPHPRRHARGALRDRPPAQYNATYERALIDRSPELFHPVWSYSTNHTVPAIPWGASGYTAYRAACLGAREAYRAATQAAGQPERNTTGTRQTAMSRRCTVPERPVS
jgi:hypothetical protein